MHIIQGFLRAHWVLIVVMGVFLAPVAFIEYRVLSITQGITSYPFDDVFIHMCIGRNLAFYGSWGISPHVFASASSSVLYPLLLAGLFKLAGAHLFFPLLLNVLAGIAFVGVVYAWLQRQQLSSAAQLCVLLGVIVLTPLPAIVCFGMEHTMQLVFCFLFVYAFSEAIEKGGSLPWQVYVYGLLVAGTRYEGVFVVAMACLLLLWQRRWGAAVLLGFVSLLPIVVFGLIAVYNGSYFIPNSVLVKSVMPPLTVAGLGDFFTAGIFNRLYFSHTSIGGVAIQHLLLLLPLTGWLFMNALRQKARYRYVLILLTAGTLLHLLFANTGVLFRYEAYLVGCAVPVIGVLIIQYGREVLASAPVAARGLLILLTLVMAMPLVLRSSAAFEIPLQGSINIYDMQYQMGRFLRHYYPTTPVAIGDIGAVSWFSTAPHLDLEGLGNLAVARSRKNHYWTPGFLAGMARDSHTPIAIVFDRSYPALLLRGWRKVAVWQIPNNVACYSDVVSFYAIDSMAAPGLRQCITAFKDSLPREVVVRSF